jgi:hypothetical protein
VRPTLTPTAAIRAAVRTTIFFKWLAGPAF